MNKPKIGKNTKQIQQVFTQAHFHIIIFFCEFVSRPLHIYVHTLPCVTFLQPIIRLVPRPCHTQHAQYSVTAADSANKSHTAACHPKLPEQQVFAAHVARTASVCSACRSSVQRFSPRTTQTQSLDPEGSNFKAEML